jgi:hypothetical protein
MGRWTLPKVICDCGSEQTVGQLESQQHQSSVRHKHHKRIAILLMKPCVTLSEIGNRLGVSRERARQIAASYGLRGFNRMHVCTLERANEFFKTYFHTLILACPFPVNPIKKCDRGAKEMFSRTKVAINGHLSLVLNCCGKRPDGKTVWIGAIKQPSLVSCEFVVSHIRGTTDYMIVPSYLWHQTLFVLNPRKGYGTKSSFHGWRNYINAWHLLESQPASEN